MIERFDAIVVGLGPVGAVLTGLLGQAGLKVAAIERSHEVYPLPRAAHFDHEIMRVFQRLGIADEALAHSRAAGSYEFRNATGDLLMNMGFGDGQAVSGWSFSYMFNQPGIERALRARLAQMPNVSVRLGGSFRSLRQHSDGVEITAVDDGGEKITLEAGYLVGCDGASSAVRQALGVGFEDYQFDEPWLVIDTIPQDPSQLPSVNLQICDPVRPTTCVLMGPGRHRWEFMLLPGEEAEDVLKSEFIESLLAPWGAAVEIERKAVYRFHGLIAEQWRGGRVLLAGDAAHQMPPFAGQGMCSGIRDAANLAWKLVDVCRSNADATLLDSYQSEREPSVRDYVALAIEMGRTVCTLDPVLAAHRDAAMIQRMTAGGGEPPPTIGGPGREGGIFLVHDPVAGTIFPQSVSADGGRLDDVLGDHAWLIDRSGGAGSDDVQHIGIADSALAPFRDSLEAWLTDLRTEAVLVRPDRYIYGTGGAEELLSSWRDAIQGGKGGDSASPR